jgi:hypothetical protein
MEVDGCAGEAQLVAAAEQLSRALGELGWHLRARERRGEIGFEQAASLDAGAFFDRQEECALGGADRRRRVAARDGAIELRERVAQSGRDGAFASG